MDISTFQEKMNWAESLAAKKGYVCSPSAIIYPTHLACAIYLSVDGKQEGCPSIYLSTLYVTEKAFFEDFENFFTELRSVEETETERKAARLAALMQEIKDLGLSQEAETAITSSLREAMTTLSSNILPRSQV